MLSKILRENNIFLKLDQYVAIVLSSLSEPAIILDGNDNVIGCNEVYLNIHQLEIEEILKANYFSYLTENDLPVPSDSRKKLLDSNVEKITCHVVQNRRSLKYYQWNATSTLLDTDNEIITIIGHDVTVLLENAIKEQLLLESLIDSVPIQIFWKNKNLEFLGCNKRFVQSLGFKDKSVIIGKTDFDLPVSKEDSEAFRKDDLYVITSKKPMLNIEEPQCFDNGEKRTLLTSKVPLFDEHSEVYGVIGIYRDITDQKKTENELKNAISLAEQANKTKSEFIANMSHDIRTPLSGVVGMSQLLVDALDNPEQKLYAKWINECGVQLLGLLNDILTVIAVDNISDKDLPNLEIFKLRQCVDEIMQLERPSTTMKGIDLNLVIDDSIPDLLVGDRPALYRILLNLLGNAIKFTTVGIVAIEIKLLKKISNSVNIEFKIVDTGIGIPEELQNKVFDRFYRGNPSYKGVYSGHGIGLHIAQSYIKRLGGELKFISKVDCGTTFYFNLVFDLAIDNSINNLQQATNAKKSAQPLEYLCVENKNPMVLLVEDNFVALKVLESIMKLLNVKFVSANDGESALEIATRQSFDLVVTDVGLPGMSGNELAIKIRDWEGKNSKSRIPVIGLTAHVREQVRELCINSGMDDVYSKPMDLSTMKGIIAKFT